MAKYILATNTEVSLLSHGPSSHHYHFEKHQSIMHTQQSFGGKCPCSQTELGMLYTPPMADGSPPLSKSRKQSDILSLISKPFVYWAKCIPTSGPLHLLALNPDGCSQVSAQSIPSLPSHPFSDEITMKPSPDCSFEGPDSTFPSLASTSCPTFPALWRQKT